MKVKFHLDAKAQPYARFDHNNKAPGLLRIFVSDHRPNGDERPGMGNLMADFAWRRSVTMKDIKVDTTFQKTIAEYLGRPIDTLKFRFNRNCGCSMCPCSPGILVQDATMRYQASNVKEVWVDIMNDDQVVALAVRPAADLLVIA